MIFCRPPPVPDHTMLPGVQIDLAKHYILHRLCLSGGFCHYGLDEPNLHDTWHALAGLRILGVSLDSKPTVRFLKSFQNHDGSFRSTAQAYLTLHGLDLLGSLPSHNPTCYIADFARNMAESFTHTATLDPAWLEDTRRIIALQRRFNIGIIRGEDIAQRIKSLQKKDGGYGFITSSLTETLQAVTILHLLDQLEDPKIAAGFIRSCEHSVTGFTDMPGTSMHFIEHVHAGLVLCQELRIIPHYTDACAASVRRCQLLNGGFARASLGIATLENTYLALDCLKILSLL